MELLSRTNTDDLVWQVRGHGAGELGNTDRWQLGNKNLSSFHAAKIVQHEIHPLLQGDPETRHLLMGDGQRICTLVNQLLEEGDDRAARTDHVTVTNHCKTGGILPRDIVCCHEELV